MNQVFANHSQLRFASLYCEFVASSERAFLIDNFASSTKALAAIGAFAERGIGRLGVAASVQCRLAQVGFPDCVANADIHWL